MKQVTTYDLIRQLAKLDPDGDMPIMIAVKYVKTGEDGTDITTEASGFVEGFSIDHAEDCKYSFIVIESTDM